MSRHRLATIAAVATMALTAGLTACSSSQPPTPEETPPPPVVHTGIITDAAPYGGEYTTTIIEVRNPDGELNVYECEPYYDKICVLLKRGDDISFTLQGDTVRDVKRIKAAADATPNAKR